MRNNLCCILLLLSFYSCQVKQEKEFLPFYHTPDFTPLWLNPYSLPDTIHRIRQFHLINQNNEIITEKTLNGKIYIANFFFASCSGICKKMNNNLLILQNTFKNDRSIQIVSHSVTPWKDSVPVLKKYGEDLGIDGSQWHLLTGKTEEIYTLARQSYFAEEEPGYNRDSTEFLHTEHVLLIDKSGHIRGVYNGTLQLEMDRLREDIGLLKEEEAGREQ